MNIRIQREMILTAVMYNTNYGLSYISQKVVDCRKYSGTSVHECLSSRTNRFTNKFSGRVRRGERKRERVSQVTNRVSSNEYTSRQQRLATSWEYWRESVSCCVTFAQYTSLLDFAVPSLKFHCVLWFFNILSNKTPMGKIVSVYEHFG
jgi:hypothetical protein